MQQLVNFFQSAGKIDAALSLEIANNFKEKVLAKNDLFLREGQVSNEYLVLTEGLMRAYAIDTNGDEKTTEFYVAVQPVFEVASFFGRVPSQENFQAITDCRGWVINFEKLNMLFHALPAFREMGRGILVKGFASLKMRMLSQITTTADKRYEALLQANPVLFQHVPLKYIASYLGITDTSLSRIRKELLDRERK
ncbi:Crp/Fnr family transcriptional regulator [Aridibaculum aurantiacum]|uniref:Crp/Fnr family transcriptional regulator n=1 Tax=Aridibaculum aurantiacum TaxID=2810307 RepID=UPI001A97233B|nr:Crp/Fnr family transcriptional regulator [Aridibaculum aurantiacum]